MTNKVTTADMTKPNLMTDLNGKSCKYMWIRYAFKSRRELGTGPRQSGQPTNYESLGNEILNDHNNIMINIILLLL